MQNEYQRPSSDELLARYIRAADCGDWHRARNVCNVAGCGPMSKICGRLDFSPQEGAMWVRLYEIAFERKAEEWPEFRRELVERE